MHVAHCHDLLNTRRVVHSVELRFVWDGDDVAIAGRGTLGDRTGDAARAATVNKADRAERNLLPETPGCGEDRSIATRFDTAENTDRPKSGPLRDVGLGDHERDSLSFDPARSGLITRMSAHVPGK